MRLAQRMGKIQPSATMATAAKARAMKAQGIDVVGFGVGEPDFDTPQHIKDAAVRALADGFTKYTAVGGIEELKDAIRGRIEADCGVRYERSQVIVSCGAKQCVYNAAMALFQEGDEVLIPAPCWVSYPEIVALTGATPVLLPTDESSGFRVGPDQVRAAVTPRTRGMILNSPSNPAGAVYSRGELEALARVVVDTGIVVISDDIYDKLVYGGSPPAHIASLGPEVREQTLMINGVSKTYAMTGWRIGYALGPTKLIAAMDTLQGQSTSNPASVAQKGAVAALNGPQECVAEMVREFDRRRRYMVARLNAMAGVRCFDPQGAFYTFPNVGECLGRQGAGRRIESAADLAEYLLQEAQIAVVAGEPFGSDRHIRLAFALGMAEIEKGLDRMEAALGKLS
jgi:aspartate aminotransferase